MNSQGRSMPCFVFNEDGAMQIAMRYDAAVRFKINQAIKKLRENKKPIIPNFNNPAEAARAWAEQYEEAEKQKQINHENKPKVEFYDTVAESDSTIDMAAVAKTINQPGYGRNNLFKLLREQKILRKNNQPYQKYVNLGYFKEVVVPIKKSWVLKNGEVWNGTKTVATAKGIDFILRIVKNDKALIDAAIDKIMEY
jgi:phage antirepressor YoqD-like protein